MVDKSTKPDGSAPESNACLTGCSELAAIFRALGHPARLEILKQLACRTDACCGEIVEHLPLAQSTVSQHLQVLKEAGLLSCDNRGRNCHYLLNWDKVSKASHWTQDFWDRLGTSECRAEVKKDA